MALGIAMMMGVVVVDGDNKQHPLVVVRRWNEQEPLL